MSDLSHAATVTADDRSLPPLVRGLRERHAALSAQNDGKTPRAKPFELRLPDRAAYTIGRGEPAFTSRSSPTRALPPCPRSTSWRWPRPTWTATSTSRGWADRTLGRLGLFRGLEWIISRWAGAQPQRNDHEWLRRFGRKA